MPEVVGLRPPQPAALPAERKTKSRFARGCAPSNIWRMAFETAILLSFGRKHGVPHVHVTGPEFRASVSIISGEIIAGKMTSTTLKEVQLWLGHDPGLAMKVWKERNPAN